MMMMNIHSEMINTKTLEFSKNVSRHAAVACNHFLEDLENIFIMQLLSGREILSFGPI